MNNKKSYYPLVKEIVLRDLKIKYRRSILGYIWSLLNPLLMMVIMTMVFSYVFRFDIDNYPLYLICGQTLWTFLNESTLRAMFSISQNASLIKKIYVPMHIFPLSTVLSSFINLGFSLVAIFIVMVGTDSQLSVGAFYALIPLVLLLVFSCGVGMILSAVSVFFRDITHIYSVFSLAWMYMTPIFYPISIVPDDVKSYLLCNPIYYYLEFFRAALIHGSLSSPEIIADCTLFSVCSLVIGAFVFSKLKKRFILYI